MNIENIELRHIRMKLASPFITSAGTGTDVEHIIVSVSGDGITGWGECVAEGNPFYHYETILTAWYILRDFLIPEIIGKKINDLTGIKKASAKVRGHKMAKAGLEAAFWDLFAKSKQVSLSRMLGGSRDKIEAGVSIGIQPTVAGLLKTVEYYMAEGYTRVKIKISPGNDLQFIKAVRNEFPGLKLQVDANSAYSMKDIDLFKKMDQFSLLLIEQPLGYEDIYEHAKLQKEINTPICLDESIHSLNDTIAAIELGSCRIINLKPGRVGGFSEARLIHDYCFSSRIPLWHGGMLETGIGRAGNVALASLPGFTLPGDISANKRYFDEDLVLQEFVINTDGTMDVPDRPGIGVEINLKMLEKVTVRKEVFRK